jgi:hypothetical protein
VADLSITVTGLDHLIRELEAPDLLDDLLRPGMTKAGVIVEGAWKGKAHRVTGKYQGSIGNEVTGRGADIAARIGPQPGLGQPRHYTKAQTSRWKKPRDGVNTGDPQVYAEYEDQGTRNRPGHPAAEPALSENTGRIGQAITDGAQAVMERKFR